MQTLFTDLTISMSDFKKNPAKVLRDAGVQPVVVLNHNKPSAYLVPASSFEAMMDYMDDITLARLVKQRSAEPSVAVRLDEL